LIVAWKQASYADEGTSNHRHLGMRWTMTQVKLEERMRALEKEVAELKAEVAKLAQPKDWRSTIGMFAGDEVMKEIFEEGR
jgi:hypothetical protein